MSGSRYASAAFIPIESLRIADKAYWDLYSHIEEICDKSSDMCKLHPKTTEMNILGNMFPLILETTN